VPANAPDKNWVLPPVKADFVCAANDFRQGHYCRFTGD
jgi:hypothetical protein